MSIINTESHNANNEEGDLAFTPLKILFALTAASDGSPKPYEFISPESAARDEIYFCPACKARVHLNCPEGKRRHFAHPGHGETCNSGNYLHQYAIDCLLALLEAARSKKVSVFVESDNGHFVPLVEHNTASSLVRTTRNEYDVCLYANNKLVYVFEVHHTHRVDDIKRNAMPSSWIEVHARDVVCRETLIALQAISGGAKYNQPIKFRRARFNTITTTGGVERPDPLGEKPAPSALKGWNSLMDTIAKRTREMIFVGSFCKKHHLQRITHALARSEWDERIKANVQTEFIHFKLCRNSVPILGIRLAGNNSLVNGTGGTELYVQMPFPIVILPLSELRNMRSGKPVQINAYYGLKKWRCAICDKEEQEERRRNRISCDITEAKTLIEHDLENAENAVARGYFVSDHGMREHVLHILGNYDNEIRHALRGTWEHRSEQIDAIWNNRTRAIASWEQKLRIWCDQQEELCSLAITYEELLTNVTNNNYPNPPFSSSHHDIERILSLARRRVEVCISAAKSQLSYPQEQERRALVKFRSDCPPRATQQQREVGLARLTKYLGVICESHPEYVDTARATIENAIRIQSEMKAQEKVERIRRDLDEYTTEAERLKDGDSAIRLLRRLSERQNNPDYKFTRNDADDIICTTIHRIIHSQDIGLNRLFPGNDHALAASAEQIEAHAKLVRNVIAIIAPMRTNILVALQERLESCNAYTARIYVEMRRRDAISRFWPIWEPVWKAHYSKIIEFWSEAKSLALCNLREQLKQNNILEEDLPEEIRGMFSDHDAGKLNIMRQWYMRTKPPTQITSKQ